MTNSQKTALQRYSARGEYKSTRERFLAPHLFLFVSSPFYSPWTSSPSGRSRCSLYSSRLCAPTATSARSRRTPTASAPPPRRGPHLSTAAAGTAQPAVVELHPAADYATEQGATDLEIRFLANSGSPSLALKQGDLLGAGVIGAEDMSQATCGKVPAIRSPVRREWRMRTRQPHRGSGLPVCTQCAMPWTPGSETRVSVHRGGLPCLYRPCWAVPARSSFTG